MLLLKHHDIYLTISIMHHKLNSMGPESTVLGKSFDGQNVLFICLYFVAPSLFSIFSH